MTAAPDRLTAALAESYRLERELGAGGMATVYLAHDLKHDRKVAVKVLRPELAAVIGAERFLNEIRVTANLQHPHILALYDSGAADTFLFYVMPYVDGETLADRLKREKQLGIEDAVRIAGEIAGALDYAHRQGVIHRDIKPANILLQDGGVLVADFGIALALKAAGGDRLTETGLSLGTPHYMSPEQAMGDRDIDARTDVYALGAVTYEMLAGEPPHTGNSVQAILSRVLTEEPRPLGDLRNSVPAHVAMAVEQALAKVPADRFGSAADFQKALRDPRFTLAHSRRTMPGPGALPPRPWTRSWQPWAAMAAVGLVALGFGRFLGSSAPADAPVARFRVPVATERGLTGAPVNTVALSPDGQMAVYVGRSSGAATLLYARRLDALEAQPIAGTSTGTFPGFNPSGTRLLYQAAGGTYTIAVPFSGSSPTLVPNLNTQALNGTLWLDDHVLVANNNDGGIITATLDGVITPVAAPDSSRGERNLFPWAALPGGHTVLVLPVTGTNSVGPVVALDTRDGSRRTVMDRQVSGVWYARGHLVWTEPNGTLNAAAFDPGGLRITGPVVTLAENVRQAIGGGGQVAVSESGSLVYVPSQPFNLVLVDRTGAHRGLMEGERFHSPRFSPDGRQLAFDLTRQAGRDVYLFDLRQRTLSRLSFEEDGHDPVWSRDGRWIAFVHGSGIWRRRADGSGSAEAVFDVEQPVAGLGASMLEYLPDGSAIAASAGRRGDFDIRIASPDGGGLEPLLASPYTEQAGTLSPNGRWLAYTSDETGRDEIYVRAYPGAGAKVLVSRGGGAEPAWSPDGRTLYYHGTVDGETRMVAASVETGPAFTVTERRSLFDVSAYEPASPHRNWDVSPDGASFVMVDQGALSEIVFILNWPEEVRRRSAGGAP